jgi:hypothetical protein
LRRPFSRKIGIRPDDMFSPERRGAALARVSPLADASPLAAALETVLHAYAGDPAAAERSLGRLVRRGHGPKVANLYETSDLRKLLLECLREHYRRFGPPPRPVVEGLFALARRTDPECRHLYDPPVRPGAAVTPMRLDYVDAPPPRLTVHLYVRQRYFGAASRPHDVGVRMRSALAREGADVRLLGLDGAADAGPCDLTLVDDALTFPKDPARKRAFLERLRSSVRRLAMLELDPWEASLERRIADSRDLYDFLWTLAPDRARGGTIAGLRACVAPFPVGFHDVFERHAVGPHRHRGRDLRFCGGVEEYNLHRYYWVLAASLLDEPIPCEVTSHVDDALPAEASLARYIERLSASYAALGFTMRRGGGWTVVGRTFDCLRLGQLLVQEYCPDIRHYVVPGEHFLEFERLGELEEIWARLRRGGDFEKIRRAGVAFFNDRYSDRRIVRHLCTYL